MSTSSPQRWTRGADEVLRRDGRAVIPPAPIGRFGGRPSRAQLHAYTHQLQHQIAAVARSEADLADQLAARKTR